ncbi:hypothetical protein B0H66DRAFT_360086 [Apodospora peruviana]|uniref:Uncharacterized protein n=1 Tax=Apodospora peruviana TaxID=516989 RepID=A0AAE0HW89_9PEZI|nr:hypothetical protein B0H66DRAFT_360086 [Apodospora peruviana]
MSLRSYRTCVNPMYGNLQVQPDQPVKLHRGALCYADLSPDRHVTAKASGRPNYRRPTLGRCSRCSSLSQNIGAPVIIPNGASWLTDVNGKAQLRPVSYCFTPGDRATILVRFGHRNPASLLWPLPEYPAGSASPQTRPILPDHEKGSMFTRGKMAYQMTVRLASSYTLYVKASLVSHLRPSYIQLRRDRCATQATKSTPS